jgi:putative hydrolases of HD superfamily
MGTLQTIADKLVDLGRLSLLFGRVNRITFHEDGVTPESDTDHTVMLGLAACALAQEVGGLDVGAVAQYALVHDLVEAYAGDMPTLRALSTDQKAEKKAREHAAFERIMREFGLDLPWIDRTIAGYERQVQPEARFVRAVDKLMPKLTHLLNGCASLRQQGMTLAELQARYDLQEHELFTYAADFPLLLDLRKELVGRMIAVYGSAEVAA